MLPERRARSASWTEFIGTNLPRRAAGDLLDGGGTQVPAGATADPLPRGARVRPGRGPSSLLGKRKPRRKSMLRDALRRSSGPRVTTEVRSFLFFFLSAPSAPELILPRQRGGPSMRENSSGSPRGREGAGERPLLPPSSHVSV